MIQSFVQLFKNLSPSKLVSLNERKVLFMCKVYAHNSIYVMSSVAYIFITYLLYIYTYVYMYIYNLKIYLYLYIYISLTIRNGPD